MLSLHVLLDYQAFLMETDYRFASDSLRYAGLTALSQCLGM